MPAAAIIVPLAVSAASTAATSALIGATLAGTLGVVGGAIVTGAIGGAIGGAITAGIEGGDVGMDVLTGAVSGGVSGGVGAELGGNPSEGISNAIQQSTGASPELSRDITTGLIKGVSGTAAGTAANLIGGQKFGQALKGGAVSGIASGVASGVGNEVFGGNQPTTGATLGTQRPSLEPNQLGTMGTLQNVPPGMDPIRFSPQFGYSPVQINAGGSFLNDQFKQGATGALQQGIQTGLNDLVGPSPSGVGQSATPNFTNSPTFNPTPTDVALGGGSPSVAALAQALRTVPDLGYSPGGPVFGSDASKANRKVWNKASLRVTDDQNQ